MNNNKEIKDIEITERAGELSLTFRGAALKNIKDAAKITSHFASDGGLTAEDVVLDYICRNVGANLIFRENDAFGDETLAGLILAAYEAAGEDVREMEQAFIEEEFAVTR